VNPSVSSPPLPPDVTSQQTPPELQFMAGAGAASQDTLQKFNSLELVKQEMTKVAAILTEVAKVLVVEKPALVKQLQIMVQAGSAIVDDVSRSAGAPPSGAGTPQAQMPSASDTAGSVSMS
jgi:hypothetical protein